MRKQERFPQGKFVQNKAVQERIMQEKALIDLCIAIAQNDICSHRFNHLLIESGVYIDDKEWEAANKLLSLSDRIVSQIRPDAIPN
ncbi:MAG: hypothetical protein IPJ69_13535 [Deltaproteobacteria bacterium]|nr:MAG: hypothetical protein IPJ69_13535 [Deltaproteobacteria bacterium]